MMEKEIEKQLSILKIFDWFHGVLERKDAEKKISEDGEFLVRLSRENDSKFVVSTKCNGKPLHVVVKTDFDPYSHQILYYIVSRHKYITISDLILFHEAEQCPLISMCDNAVLQHAVSKKEHKFKKGIRLFHKPKIKTLPRSGSTSLIVTTNGSDNFTSMNASLTMLPITNGDTPVKQPFRLFTTKNPLARLSSEKFRIPNEKLLKENEDPSQSRDVEERPKKEKVRRGRSIDALFSARFIGSHGEERGIAEGANGSFNIGKGSVSYRSRKKNANVFTSIKKKTSLAFLAPDPITSDTLEDIKTRSGIKKKASSVYVVPNTIIDHASLVGRRNGSNRFIPPSNTINNALIDESSSPHSNTDVIIRGTVKDDTSFSFTSTNPSSDSTSYSGLSNDTDTTVNLTRNNSSIYVIPRTPVNDASPLGPSDNTATRTTLTRKASSIYVIPNTTPTNASEVETSESSTTQKNASILALIEDIKAKRKLDPNSSLKRDSSVYVIPAIQASTAPSTRTPPAATFTLGPFINLSLSLLKLSYCGSINHAFDPVFIDTTATFLLSHPNNPSTLCRYLLEELRRIFILASTKKLGVFNIGYLSLFLVGSERCYNDLVTRQTSLTYFVTVTILGMKSNERRIEMIMFWMKCVDNLLTKYPDLFHCRSIVTAMLSRTIANLDVWPSVYRQDPSMKGHMQSLRKAISNGCFSRTDLDKCVPDIVHLYQLFTGDDSDFEEFGKVCLDIMSWPIRSFNDTFGRLLQMQIEPTSSPFLRELVQTETLLSVIVGRISVNHSELATLLTKAADSINSMVNTRADNVL